MHLGTRAPCRGVLAWGLTLKNPDYGGPLFFNSKLLLLLEVGLLLRFTKATGLRPFGPEKPRVFLKVNWQRFRSFFFSLCVCFSKKKKTKMPKLQNKQQ